MTLTRDQRPGSDLSVAAEVRPLLTPHDLLVAQLAGVSAWQQAFAACARAVHAPGLTREQRLDAARALQVREREQEALRAHLSDDVPRRRPVVDQPAVLVHRHPWLRGALAAALGAHGLAVLDVGDNGADAVGACVAEQPPVLLLDDTLGMRTGPEVAQEVRRLCPHTLVVGHVSSTAAVGPLLEAGAHLVLTRSVRPAEVAARVAALLAAARQA